MDGGGEGEGEEGMWKGLVSVGVLKQALCHHDPQVIASIKIDHQMEKTNCCEGSLLQVESYVLG